jgi:hypothetical protein
MALNDIKVPRENANGAFVETLLTAETLGISSNNARLTTECYEEFLGVSDYAWDGGLQLVANGYDGLVVNDYADYVSVDGAQGVYRFQTGPNVGATNPTRIGVSGNASSMHFGQGSEIETVWRVRFLSGQASVSGTGTLGLPNDTNLSGVVGAGFVSSLHTNGNFLTTRGLYFQSKDGSPWKLVVRNNGNEIEFNPAILVPLMQNTWYTFRIRVNAAGTVVSAWIDNTAIAPFNMTTLASTYNLTSAGNQVGWGAGVRKNVQTTSSHIGMDVDFAYLRIGGSAFRW